MRVMTRYMLTSASFNGDSLTILQAAVSECNAFLAARRAELANIVPPGRAAGAAEWDYFRSKKLLRVIPGDEGFTAWTQDKLAFYASIKAAAREYFAIEEDNVDDNLVMEEVESSFPLVLEEI